MEKGYGKKYPAWALLTLLNSSYFLATQHRIIIYWLNENPPSFNVKGKYIFLLRHQDGFKDFLISIDSDILVNNRPLIVAQEKYSSILITQCMVKPSHILSLFFSLFRFLLTHIHPHTHTHKHTPTYLHLFFTSISLLDYEFQSSFFLSLSLPCPFFPRCQNVFIQDCLSVHLSVFVLVLGGKKWVQVLSIHAIRLFFNQVTNIVY